MSSNSDSDLDQTPELIKKEAQTVIENLLPPISKERYIKTYNEFTKWRVENRVKSFSESVFLTYFNELSKKLQPSTLWSIFSMLKTTINTRHDIHLQNYTRLVSFLKRKSSGFKCKKSKVFSAQEVETFLNQAPDEIYLAVKVALIFGISGACRSIELTNLTVDNVQKHGELLLVKLPNTKTKIDRSFIVREEFGQFVEKYRNLRPGNLPTNRFFLKYQRGRCLKQVIGRNKLSSMPMEIATYLNLANPKLYTGHCFRRTSATLLADSGANLTMLKRHGGWKSSTVAESYIEDSVENKSKISSKITETINLRSTSPQPGTSKTINLRSTSPQPGTSKDSGQYGGPHTDAGTSKDSGQYGGPHTDALNSSSKERMSSPTFTDLPVNDTQISQKISNINIPGKNLSLAFTNCSNFTINFN